MRKTLAYLAANMLIAASTISASADDFGGSFGPSVTDQQQAPAVSDRDCGSDSFGGSFGLNNPLCPDDTKQTKNEETSATPEARPAEECEDPLKGSFVTDCAQVAVERTNPPVETPADESTTTSDATPSGDDDFGEPERVVQPPRSEEPERRKVEQRPVTRPKTRPDGPPVQRQVAQIPARITRFETQDFGVAPVRRFHTGAMHAPTPTSIPGGRLLTTQGLLQVAASGSRVLLLDVLGSQSTLPGALSVPVMARGRSLNDDVQAHVRQGLDQLTGRQLNTPIIVFCADPRCWLSYNGALRAVAAGYRQVYWYRGGHAAWRMAGGKFVRANR